MPDNTYQCDLCAYYTYDDSLEMYICDAYLDEDDLERMSHSKNKSCPYFRPGDEYSLVRKQN